MTSRITSSHTISARQTRPTAEGRMSGSGRIADAQLGTHVGLAGQDGQRSAQLCAERAAAARQQDADGQAAVLRRPAMRLRAPAGHRVLEIADDRERQRGQAHGNPVEQPAALRAGRAEFVARLRERRGLDARRRPAPLLREERRRAVEHRARRSWQDHEPEDHREDLAIGVDEAALDREPRDVVARRVRSTPPPRHARERAARLRAGRSP